MKKIFVFIVLFFLTTSMASAQSLERQVIGSAGTYQSATTGTLSSTAGEAVAKTLSAASNTLTQGFQQPMASDVMVYSITNDVISVQVYPSPAVDFVNVVINSEYAEKRYSVTLFDLPGHRLEVPFKDLSIGPKTHYRFEISTIAAATYLILINDEHNQQVKAIKFTKTN